MSTPEPRGRPFDHAANFAAKHLAINPMRAAIEWLLPPPIAKPDLINLFEGRASYQAIRAWRYGVCAAPQWARDMVDQHIARRLAPGATIQEAVRAAPAGRGQGWNRGAATLAAWRVRKAAERDAQAAKDVVP